MRIQTYVKILVAIFAAALLVYYAALKENDSYVRRLIRSVASVGRSWDEASECPQGPILTVNSGGRLGNKICQYLTLWVLAREMAGSQARILPPMEQKLNRHFTGPRQVAPLTADCSSAISWEHVTIGESDTFSARLDAGSSLHITGGPCPMAWLYPRRDAVLAELPWRANVSREVERRLTRVPPGTRTLIGVHVRRDDYGEWLRSTLNGHLVSPAYLRCALRLARRRYPRPAFLVSSDDMNWCREHIVGDDVMYVGSDASEAFDMATLARCTHSIVTYGTFGYISALLAGGDIIAPTGFSETEYWLSDILQKAGANVTKIRDGDAC